MQPQVPGRDPATAEAGTPPTAPARGVVYGRASVPATAAPTTAAGAADEPGAGISAGTGDGARRKTAGPGRRFRTLLIAVLATIVVLVLATAVLGLVRPGPVKNWLGALGREGGARHAPTAVATSEPAPPPVLAAAGGGKQPSPAAVKTALDPLVSSRALGSKVQAAVLDAATGDVLYARDADIPTTPASTTKVLTAVSVLATRGPAYRLSTRVVAGSRPGEVVLVGGGDPTLSADAAALFPGAARLDQLATQVRTALGGTRPTRVLIDTSLFGGPETGLGWDSRDVAPDGQVSRIQALMTNGGRVEPVHHEHGGDPRSSDPALAAGQAFAKLLGVPAGSVSRGRAPAAPHSSASQAPAPASNPPASNGPPAAGTQLGAVQSPPLVRIIEWMLQQSDNTVAEMLGRQVALAAGKPATFDGTTEAILSTLRGLGLPADEGDLYDASGLSRHDGISPALLAQTLALAANGGHPTLAGVFDGLPVAGWSGTLADRFGTPAGATIGRGVVRAKTGTLSGVNTMAGVLVTKDGRLLVFAIMANGSSDANAAKAALDRVSARLVACGC